MKSFEFLHRVSCGDYFSLYIYEENGVSRLKYVNGNDAPFIDIKYARKSDYRDNPNLIFGERILSENEVYDFAESLISEGLGSWAKRYVGQNAAEAEKWLIKLTLNKTLRLSSQGAGAFPEEWGKIEKLVKDLAYSSNK